MPIYKLIKNDKVENIIIADEVDSIKDQYDSIEEVIETIDNTPKPRVWTQDSVRSALTLAEKTKWDNDSAPEVKTAKIEIGGGLELAAITEVLDFLVDANVISADSKTAVLA